MSSIRFKSLFLLIDCNNFYVSCERLFRPDLRDKPVVVLSNNDGCIVSRSPEVKAIGIPMGEPEFKARPLIQKYGIEVFSSNYELYGDMIEYFKSAAAEYIDISDLFFTSGSIEIRVVDEKIMDYCVTLNGNSKIGKLTCRFSCTVI